MHTNRKRYMFLSLAVQPHLWRVGPSCRLSRIIGRNGAPASKPQLKRRPSLWGMIVLDVICGLYLPRPSADAIRPSRQSGPDLVFVHATLKSCSKLGVRRCGNGSRDGGGRAGDPSLAPFAAVDEMVDGRQDRDERQRRSERVGREGVNRESDVVARDGRLNGGFDVVEVRGFCDEGQEPGVDVLGDVQEAVICLHHSCSTAEWVRSSIYGTSDSSLNGEGACFNIQVLSGDVEFDAIKRDAVEWSSRDIICRKVLVDQSDVGYGTRDQAGFSYHIP